MADDFVVVMMLAVGFGALRYFTRRDRWAEQMAASGSLVKLEQITHPSIEISGSGDYYVEYEEVRDGRIRRYKLYCPSLEFQREIAAMQQRNGASNVRRGLRTIGEWKSWSVPPSDHDNSRKGRR